MKPLYLLYINFLDFVSKEFALLFKLRRFWLELFIGSLFAAIKYHHPIAWTMFGMFSGGLIANIKNDSPVFVRAWGDAVYMLQNPIIGVLNTRVLTDRIFISLFGITFDEVLPIRALTLKFLLFRQKKKTDFNITLMDFSIIGIEGSKSKYLSLRNTRILHGFSDPQTLSAFCKWAEDKGHKLLNEKSEILNTKDINKNYIQGKPVASFSQWQDPVLLSREKDK